jgi:hypothetical protein
MTPESRNSPLLDNGSLRQVLWRCGFEVTDLVLNALSISTESTKIYVDTRKQQIFSMDTR